MSENMTIYVICAAVKTDQNSLTPSQPNAKERHHG
ncbi:hypothetical protein J2803_004293 [Paraburkholderia phenoliruptrix]|nr:hypothetical protein [Paraburkholderia phenoliruptrix]